MYAKTPNAQLIERLITAQQAPIKKFIRRRAGTEVLARMSVGDLYHDTLTRAIESAESFEYRDEHQFLSWIHTIIRRVLSGAVYDLRCGPRILRVKGAESTGAGIPEGQLDAGCRTPSSIVAGRESKSRVRIVMQGLPEHYRTALTLYRIEERTIAEVAKRIGRTPGATAQLIQRATHAFRLQLEEL